MAKQPTDDDVKMFMASDEYKMLVREMKARASNEKLTLSPNDVPAVAQPLDEDHLRLLFATPFLVS
jgi:hypothetical protein